MIDPQKFAQARQIIEERGWSRGALESYNGVCLRGALCIACTGRARGMSAEAAELEKFISVRILRGRNIPSWNDSRFYKSDVLKVLMQAEELAALARFYEGFKYVAPMDTPPITVTADKAHDHTLSS